MEPEPVLPTPREVPALPSSSGLESPSYTASKNEVISHSPEQGNSAPQLIPSVAVDQTQTGVASVVAPTTATSAPQATSDSPAIADDVEVIEKEWVDKAKKIVSATKDDPHKQEKEVNKLQADYLMKRYGKQIKLVD